MSPALTLSRGWLVVRTRTVSLVRRSMMLIPAPLVWLTAVGGILYLSEGGLPGSRVATGFAERVTLSVAPIRPGRVKTVNLRLGQAVKQGEVLATLETDELEARLAQARALLVELKAKVEAERENLHESIARSKILMLKARAGAQEDRAKLRELDLQLKRLESLAVQKLVAAPTVEAARRERAAAAARTAAFTGAEGEASELADAPSGIPQYSALSFADAVAIRLAPSQEAVKTQEAAIRLLELELEGMTLRAPAEGIIATVSKRQGEYALAGSEVATLVSTRGAHIAAFLPMRVARELALGAVVKVKRTGSLARPKPGTVVEIAPSIEEVPARLRLSPQIAQYGRRVIIETADAVELVPGETFDVVL